MRGVIVYLAIGCLALANGAPTDDESKVNTKHFHFEKKEMINSFNMFVNDELVYAVCDENNDSDKKCTVYVESAPETPGQEIVQSCDLNLKYTGTSNIDVALFNAGNSKAVVALREGETKIKLISVNLKGCHIKEASVDVPQQLTKEEVLPLALKVVIVPHENNYDIVYQNKEICHDFLCKATFDYEGKAVKPASGFLVEDMGSSHLQIETVNNGYLVNQNNFEQGSKNVYLVHDGDTKPHTLFSVANRSAGNVAVGLSTSENKLSYCADFGEKLECKQYDAEGKNKKLEVQIASDKGISGMYLNTYNLEKGLLAVSVGREVDSSAYSVSVLSFDEQGKQVKSVKVDLNCEAENALFPKLYKRSNGQYCVSSACLPYRDSPKKNDGFSRTTKCFSKSDLF